MENLTKRLEEITINITDGKHGDCENQENSGYFFISCKDVDNGRIDYSNARQITKESFVDADKRTNLEVNDILITNSGTIGRMALMKSSNEYIRNTTFQKSVAIIKPNADSIYPEYLYYYLIANRIFLIELSNGAAQKNLLLSTLRDFKVTYPCSVEKQKSIANHISKYDELIEVNNQRIKELEQTAEELYKEWFVRFRFPNWQNTEYENGIPRGWNEKQLSEVADVTMGQSPPSDCYNEDKTGLPFHQGVGSYGEWYLVDNIYSSEGKRIAEPNSIIFSVRAPVGRINITLNRIILGRGVASINAKDKNNAFLLWQLKNIFQKEDIIGNGSIFTSVTKDELLKQKVIVPNQGILELFERNAKSIEKQIRTVYLSNQNLIKQRDLLLPRLMSGKLEV